MDNKKNPNKLINEKSPYLFQHAYNPVNWYSWGEEAFEKAKAEDKPIFLSIGYSTCHWCHVMEHESFENNESADILNKHFVSIKVDREERPDVDAVYMSVCMSMNGSGGWPMTIIMTPDQKPFFSATYLPKTSRYGLMGLDELLLSITELWDKERDKLTYSAEKISDFISKQDKKNIAYDLPSKEIITNGADILKKNFDSKNGGYGSAPKFPTPHNMLFLMKYSQLEDDKFAVQSVMKTLTQMYRGGIFDHIGGGFSRYSTDEKWLVPHFEKMLYDNALLIYSYVNAYQITEKLLFKQVAVKTINYVFSELNHENGGFFCGQDADSDGVEGKYYVFYPDEIKSVLGESDGKIFCDRYDITENGNFEDKSIPNLLKNEDYEVQDKSIEEMSKKLFDYRIKRTKLHKDDKILVSWNALMIVALSKAYQIIGDKSYLNSAEKSIDFIEKNLVQSDGKLMVRWRDGESAGDGKIDDYAFYAWALLEIYDATFNLDYLKRAGEYAQIMCDRFFDEKEGGFYLYSDDGEQLISRPKEVYDGAIPSGNSVAAFVLEKLFSLTAINSWGEKSKKQMCFLASNINEYPAGYSFSIISMMKVLYPTENLVCVSNEDDIENKLHQFLKTHKKTDIDIIIKKQSNEAELKIIAPYTSEYEIPTQGTMYYLCKNGACLAPVNDLNKLFD